LPKRDLAHWNILEEIVLAEPSSIDKVYDVTSLSAEVQFSRVGDDYVVWVWSGLEGSKLQSGHDVCVRSCDKHI
jgi:hypothetical protein